jgi:hypothetical protein
MNTPMFRAPKMSIDEFVALKPSQQLRIAVADLKEVEKSNKHIVAMSRWHWPGARILSSEPVAGPPNVCYVCLAGSVLAVTLDSDPDRAIEPDSGDEMTDALGRVLYAINYFCHGQVRFGLRLIAELPIECNVPMGVTVPPYQADTNHEFHAAMEGIAVILETNGF